MKKYESYKKNKFKISASSWNEEFELCDGSDSLSDIQDYFEYNNKIFYNNKKNKGKRLIILL